MATATQPVRTKATELLTGGNGGLDQVVSETERRRRSLVKEAGDFLGVPPGKLCDLLRNVWTVSKGKPPLTDQEMFTGISLIARYQLDPITREIYVTRASDGRLMTVVGIDGWIKVLDRTEGYDGFDVEIHHDEQGKLEWVDTRIYSTKRQHPAVYRAYWKEYSSLTGFMGGKIPSHMLRIFGLRHAARLFTPLGATVVTEEEAAVMMRAEAPDAPEQPSKLDELADQLMSRLAKPADPQPEEPSTTPTPAPDAPEPAPADDPWSGLKERAAACQTLDSLDALEADACLDASEEEQAAIRGVLSERRQQLSRRGKHKQKELGE